MTIDFEGLPLSASAGGAEDPCLQQKAALVHAHIHGYLDSAGLDVVLTDRPCWQNEVINWVGIEVNDRLPARGGWFERLDSLTPRMVAATRCGDPVVERRVNVRLLCWLAREVLPVFEDRFPGDGRPRRAIEEREAWLRGEASEDDCAAAAEGAAGAARTAGDAWADAGAAWAAEAARAAGAAWVAWAARTAGAAWADAGAGRLLELLDGLCDQHDKAKAEEGAALDDGWLLALQEAGLIEDATGGV